MMKNVDGEKKKIIMYPHGGSGNHGCEAIIRGTCIIVSEFKCKKLFSSAIDQDEYVELTKLCEIDSESQKINRKSLSYFKALVQYYIKKDKDAFDKLAFKNIIDAADSHTIALSIGGDNYCYGRPGNIYVIKKYVREKGAKTVLWGCSVEPTAIDKEMEVDLASYNLIVARESITYEILKKINPNTVLYPDPAFQLIKKEVFLPEVFLEHNTVGINISPMIIENEINHGITLKNYERLIEYIIYETNMNIAFIPHVCWEHNDDRRPLYNLYHKYQSTKRVVMIDEHNCMELKGYISKCRFFIGARTHATIAAYSTCVPTLVVGYSVKAKGIAKDIFGTYKNYVIPVQVLKQADDLKQGFLWLYKNENNIKKHLREIMPGYIDKALWAGEEIKKL